MSKIENALQAKIDERERLIELFASKPARATFPEIRELDYQIEFLRYLIEQVSRR
jgi:hypothetical protein